MDYPKDKEYSPKRICFYPDGHRRWSEKQDSSEDAHTIRKQSYILGAKTCIRFIKQAQKHNVKMVDIFLTRPSTYKVDIQDREKADINSIHEVIESELVKSLSDQNYSVNVYTRSDRPKYATPEELEGNSIEVWKSLIAAAKRTDDVNIKLQVNLLINYDGYIEAQCYSKGIAPTNPLPTEPSIDAIIRTAPKDNSMPHRISSGPTMALAETSFIIIPKSAPEVTESDLEEAFQKLISFRQNKKHQPISIQEK